MPLSQILYGKDTCIYAKHNVLRLTLRLPQLKERKKEREKRERMLLSNTCDCVSSENYFRAYESALRKWNGNI